MEKEGIKRDTVSLTRGIHSALFRFTGEIGMSKTDKTAMKHDRMIDGKDL